MSHWNKMMLLSGATCAVTAVFVWYNKPQGQANEEGKEDESLLGLVYPPAYTVYPFVACVVTSGSYFIWRLVTEAARVGVFYALSSSALLLNKTQMTRIKVFDTYLLGTTLASAGFLITSTYFMQVVQGDLGPFLFCSAMGFAPLLYSMILKAQVNLDAIVKKTMILQANFQKNKGYEDIMVNSTTQSLQDRWDKYDPEGKGLLSDQQLTNIVVDHMSSVITKSVDSWEEQSDQWGILGFMMRHAAPSLKSSPLVKSISKKIVDNLEKTDGDMITKEQFLKIWDTNFTMLSKTMEMVSRSSLDFLPPTSVAGAMELAKNLNNIGST